MRRRLTLAFALTAGIAALALAAGSYLLVREARLADSRDRALEQTRFNLGASHRMTWLNSLGAEWRNDLQLGYHDRFSSEFYQPLHFASGAFVAPRFEAHEKPITFFVDGRRIGEYRVHTARGHLDRHASDDRLANRRDHPCHGQPILARHHGLPVVNQAIDEMADALQVEPLRRAIAVVLAVGGAGFIAITRKGDALIVLVDLQATIGAKEGHGRIDH